MTDITLKDNITWISAKTMIQLREQAKQLPLASGKIHAKQGGAYLSSFKGRGMEFDESRLYLPGDDIRSMDWRVTARTGTAHTKVFREERERPVLLWLDLNASMMFATRTAFKAVIASKIASLLAWSTANNNDRLGALIFAADQHTEIRPKRGKHAVLDLIGRITQHDAWHNNTHAKQNRNMHAAVTRLRKVTRPGSLIFMISDFREMDKPAEQQLTSLARHNDVVLIHVTDPIETQLPARGQYHVSDGSTTIQLNTNDRTLRKTYSNNHGKHSQHLITLCRQYRMYYLHVSTQDDCLSSLQTGLGMRANMHSQFRAG